MLFLLVGLAFMVAGVAGVRSIRRLVKNGLPTVAAVVDMDVKTSSDGEGGTTTVYRPILSFRAADRQWVRATSVIGTARPVAGVGEQVRVIYDPRNPERVIVDTPQARRMAVFQLVALVGAGIVLFQIYQMVR